MGAKFGHEVSPGTRAKISASLKGRKRPDLSAKLKGRKADPEVVKRRADGARRYFTDVCAIDGCERKRNAHGWCSTHYRRWRLYGDPLHLKDRPSGSDNPNWKGDEIGYSAAHWRVKKLLARQCLVCETTKGKLEIALRHDTEGEHLRNHTDPRSGIEVPYSIATDDYVRLCVRCHRRYDSPRADTRQPIEEAVIAALPRQYA